MKNEKLAICSLVLSAITLVITVTNLILKLTK